jgi:hypothetical protein
MSDEAAVSTEAPAATETQSNGGMPPSGPREQSQSVDIAKPSPQQADTPPETPDKDKADEGQTQDGKAAPETDKGKGQGQKPPEAPPVTGIDGQYADMLKAQGIDPAKISSPEVLNKLLGNYHQLQSQFTRERQAEAAKKALTEAQSVLPKPPEPGAQEPKYESPLEQFQAGWDLVIKAHLAPYGVQTLDELKQKDPVAYQHYKAQYLEKRQIAWEENQEWKQQQAYAAAEKQKREIGFKNDWDQSLSTMQANLAEAKKTMPEIEKAFKAHGIDDLFKHLEDQYSVPRNFILSDKKWVDVFAKAASAMEVVANMDAHDKEVKENYRKELDKQRAARLPSGSGGQETMKPAEKPKIQDTSTRGVSF